MPSSVEVFSRHQIDDLTGTYWDNDILLRSRPKYFFYPAGGYDWSPISLFADHDIFNSFVYCDYSIQVNAYSVFTSVSAINGFEVLEFVNLGPGYKRGNRLRNWSDYYSRHYDGGFGNPEEGFAIRVKLRTPGNRKIFLYYFGTEAIGTAKILRDTAGQPKCVAVQDCGFGGYWAPFGGESELYRIFRGTRIYLDDNTEAWPNYIAISDPDEQVFGVGTKSIYSFRRPER